MILTCPPAQQEYELSVKVHLERGASVSQHGGGNRDRVEEVMVARGEKKGEIRRHTRSISQPGFDFTLQEWSYFSLSLSLSL